MKVAFYTDRLFKPGLVILFRHGSGPPLLTVVRGSLDSCSWASGCITHHLGIHIVLDIQTWCCLRSKRRPRPRLASLGPPWFRFITSSSRTFASTPWTLEDPWNSCP